MNVFGIGLPEIAVIAALGLLVFGPKRLPELGRTLGKTLKGFQEASSEFEREIQKAMVDPEKDSEGTISSNSAQEKTSTASKEIKDADLKDPAI